MSCRPGRPARIRSRALFQIHGMRVRGKIAILITVATALAKKRRAYRNRVPSHTRPTKSAKYRCGPPTVEYRPALSQCSRTAARLRHNSEAIGAVFRVRVRVESFVGARRRSSRGRARPCGRDHRAYRRQLPAQQSRSVDGDERRADRDGWPVGRSIFFSMRINSAFRKRAASRC